MKRGKRNDLKMSETVKDGWRAKGSIKVSKSK